MNAHAADIFYHKTCYTQLRYAASKVSQSVDSTSHGHSTPVFNPMVTAQLVLYMAESGKVFKRTHLESLYKEKLKELGHPCPNINPTWFKDHLLNNLPAGWHSFTKGWDVFLSHSNTVGKALAQTCEQSEINQDDALLLMKAAAVLRKHILVKQDPFTGSFPPNCLTGPVLNHCSPSCWCYFRVCKQTSKALAGLMMEMLVCTKGRRWRAVFANSSCSMLSNMALHLKPQFTLP